MNLPKGLRQQDQSLRLPERFGERIGDDMIKLVIKRLFDCASKGTLKKPLRQGIDGRDAARVDRLLALFDIIFLVVLTNVFKI